MRPGGPWGVFLLWGDHPGAGQWRAAGWAAKQERKQVEKLAKKQTRRERRELDGGDASSAS
jgi:hypothetical protein